MTHLELILHIYQNITEYNNISFRFNINNCLAAELNQFLVIIIIYLFIYLFFFFEQAFDLLLYPFHEQLFDISLQ